MPKKRVYQKKPFESDGSSSDISANLYKSMLTSKAWNDLTARQQVLYVYCKLRLYGQTTKQKEKLFQQFEGLTIPKNLDTFFSLSIGNVTEDYKLYSKTNLNAFYRDLEALIKHGFIKCVACGNIARVKSIYQYSDKWQLWDTDEFKIQPEEMTSAMKKKHFATIKTQ